MSSMSRAVANLGKPKVDISARANEHNPERRNGRCSSKLSRVQRGRQHGNRSERIIRAAVVAASIACDCRCVCIALTCVRYTD